MRTVAIIEQRIQEELRHREQEINQEMRALILAVTRHVNMAHLLERESYLHLVLYDAPSEDRAEQLFGEINADLPI
ncbi:hypothetical protein [Phytohalomonas tamaricis]|uniref:hypothetical protein n=1 Tax=Phytohalomonas tamaricis TaxID=2081032 RepID=UPI000D0BD435|nr:hypothetical protein [Phytohalomonas tamaricis]